MADRAEIGAQLEGLEPRAAAAVGLRAAMRVLPVLARREQSNNEPFAYWPERERSRHVLNIFRCYQTSIFGNSLPKIDSAADAAADAAYAAYAAADATTATNAATTNAATNAAYAAYAAAAATNAATTTYAAYAAYAAAYATTAVDTDLEFIRQGRDIAVLLVRPLWPKAMPAEMRQLWGALYEDLRSLNANFDVWINWYRDRLEGMPLDLELERKWALLSDAVLKREPAELNAYLKSLRDGAHLSVAKVTAYAVLQPNPDNPDQDLPELPEEQEPGVQFAITPDGKIDLKPSGIAPPDDLAEIAAMRGAIVEALEDVIATLDGSNAYGTICNVARRYKSTITADTLSIDQLYAYGVRLENASARLAQDIASGDYPDMAVPAGEALDSVVALHGPTIYSTARGRELIDRARKYDRQEADERAYKEKAQAVAERIFQADDIATENAREIIKQINEDIGVGPHPDRSTELPHTANSNFFTEAARSLIDDIKGGARDGIRSSAKWAVTGTVATTSYAAYVSVPALWEFFIINAPLLRDFAIAAGSELSWLPCFLDWLNRQHNRSKR